MALTADSLPTRDMGELLRAAHNYPRAAPMSANLSTTHRLSQAQLLCAKGCMYVTSYLGQWVEIGRVSKENCGLRRLPFLSHVIILDLPGAALTFVLSIIVQ